MNNPEKILRTLDTQLKQRARLILYGRAALALGFPDAPVEFSVTLDVDAILPDVELASIENDDSFWQGIEQTNQLLDSEGLYLTHLFTDSQIIITPNWLENIQPVHLDGLRLLELFRPSTEDLLLTKMMRNDPLDRTDMIFLLKQADISMEEMESLLKSARIPDIPELHEAFEENSKWLKAQL